MGVQRFASRSGTIFRRAAVGTAIAAVFAAMATSAVAGPTATHVAQSLNIRFASSVPGKTATGQAAARIGSALAGQKDFSVQSYLNSSLYTQTQMPQAIETGAVNIAVTASDAFATIEPALALQGLPLLWASADDAEAAISGPLRPELTRLFAKHGLVYLGALLFGPINTFGGSKLIRTPADLRGQKIRSATTIFSKILTAYGAAPVVIDSAETVTALQRGTVDGAFSAAVSFTATGWDHVIKYATVVPLNFGFYPVLANASWWSSLTPDQQRIISVVVNSDSHGVPNLLATWNDKALATMRSEGIQIYEVPSSQYQLWRKALAPVANYYYSTAGDEGRKLVRLARSAPSVTVTITVKGRGEVIGAGKPCQSTCKASITLGNKLTLRARAAKGYRFSGWRGACTRRAACAIQPKKAAKVVAIFRKAS